MEKPSTSELSEVRIHIDPDPASDELLVEWKGPGDPACQFNWSLSKRWAITLLCSMGGMVILISASMLAPALNNIGDGLGISESEANMVVSIFVLVFAFGPMVLALLAEVFGHRWGPFTGWADSEWPGSRYRVCNHSAGAGRLLASGAARSFLCDRNFRALLGPAIGPILGGIITTKIGWRWLFWVVSIFDAALVIYAIFFFPETYHRLLLHRKAIKLQKETSRPFSYQDRCSQSTTGKEALL
ncbi:Major facilitator superfamily [Penicillium roqueforti FM164]|uniref:Major facilitator superfamily n=1 Tax=Penicillium roqueforti (strain FM164) TaxID=1365484 RepID=W6PQD8_PENRF|nr:Major facilitator superfamily [Penicillium roqueforti FM164]